MVAPWIRLGLLAVLSATMLASPVSRLEAGTKLRDVEATARVVAMLENRRLVELDAQGRLVAQISLGPVRPISAAGHFLAQGARGSLVALEPPGAGLAQSVFSISPTGLKIERRIALTPGIQFRTVVVGRRTGAYYLFGQRVGAGGASAPVLETIDVRRGTRAGPFVLRPATDADWFVYDAALSPDEKTAYVSYHGACSESCRGTSGADVFHLVDGVPTRCPGIRQKVVNLGCLPLVHGAIAPYQGGLLAMTGGNTILDLASNGSRRRAWTSGIPLNHLMEFALDAAYERLFVIGPCDYSGGLSEVDLRTNTKTVFDYPTNASLPRSLCGARIAFGANGLLAIAKNPQSVPIGAPAEILIARASSPTRPEVVSTPVEVDDVLVLTA